MKIRRIKKGFTLVELVVVIAVIAILSAVSVGAYFGITDSANHSRAEAEAKAFWTEVNAAVIAGRGNTESYNVNSSRDGWTFSKYDHLTVQDLVDNATLIEQRHYVYISDNFAHAKEKEAETNNQVYFFASSYDSETTASVVKYFGYIPSNLDGKYVKYIDVVTGALVENPASNGAVVAPKTYDVYFAHRFYENAYMYAYEASVDPAPSSRINSTVLKANENEAEDEIYFKEWPGIQGTEIKNGVFKFTLDFSKKSYNTVIFNNGKDCGHQTEKFDISIETIRETPYLNGNTGEWEAFAELNFENHGFYIIGNINGVENWSTVDSKYLFSTIENEPKVQLQVNLNKGSTFKIVTEKAFDNKHVAFGYGNVDYFEYSGISGIASLFSKSNEHDNIIVNKDGLYIIDLKLSKYGNDDYELKLYYQDSEKRVLYFEDNEYWRNSNEININPAINLIDNNSVHINKWPGTVMQYISEHNGKKMWRTKEPIDLTSIGENGFIIIARVINNNGNLSEDGNKKYETNRISRSDLADYNLIKLTSKSVVTKHSVSFDFYL